MPVLVNQHETDRQLCQVLLLPGGASIFHLDESDQALSWLYDYEKLVTGEWREVRINLE
jgi:hypothetical protein